jgi:hypothetical protein
VNPGLGANDAIGLQANRKLKLFHCLFQDGTEYSISTCDGVIVNQCQLAFQPLNDTTRVTPG